MKTASIICKKIAFFLIVSLLGFIILLNILTSLHPGGLRGESLIYFAPKSALSVLLVFPFILLVRKISKTIKYKHLLLFFVFYSLSMIIASFIILKPNFVADAGVLRAIAADPSYSTDYIQAYPNNLGFLSLLIIFTRAHINVIIAILIVNSLCYGILCFSLLKLCNILSFGELTKKNLLILLMTFLPLYYEVLFFYNDMLGICFSAFSIYQIIAWRKTGKYRNLILFLIAVFTMYFFRQNTLIPLIAAMIYIVFSISKKTIIPSIIALSVSIIFVLMIPATLKQIYSNRYGWDFGNGNNAPSISFIAMASMDSTETEFGSIGTAIDIPGWWNAYNYDCPIKLKKECSSHAISLLKSQASAYLHNPKRGFLFLYKKISSQWADPTFLLPYAFINDHVPEEGIITEEKVFYLHCEIIHSAILLLSTLGVLVLANRKKISWETLLPLIAVFGYFLFSIIWEAKSRYIMLVFPLLLPFAAYCIPFFKLSAIPSYLKGLKRRPRNN